MFGKKKEKKIKLKSTKDLFTENLLKLLKRPNDWIVRPARDLSGGSMVEYIHTPSGLIFNGRYGWRITYPDDLRIDDKYKSHISSAITEIKKAQDNRTSCFLTEFTEGIFVENIKIAEGKAIEEIIDWLIKSTEDDWHLTHSADKVWFKNKDDAMRFKLAWG